MPEPVEVTDPDGVDYARVMQLTFVLTIVVGVPVVAVASIPFSLPTWNERALFAVRIGAIVWFVTAVAVFLHERRRVAAAEAADRVEGRERVEEREGVEERGGAERTD